MVSVAMATYNGGRYIRKQIETVLLNLTYEDELIISDDGSVDDTIEIIKSFKDTRIKLFYGPRKGSNKNFENAIIHCQGDFIFLCDQDDIWFPDKVKKVVDVLSKTDAFIAQHDCIVSDDNNKIITYSYFKTRMVRSGFIKNIIRGTYHGCCLAFKKSLVNKIIPIPQNTRMMWHDQWIGLIGNWYGDVVYIDEVLMDYKRHNGCQSNFTPYPRYIQLKRRIYLVYNLLKYLCRRKF